MASSYQYEKLPGEGYIRILTLRAPFDRHLPICGDLEAAPLSKSSKYAALSYCWGMDKDGDASLSRFILINGRRLAITQNLYEGLRRIEDPKNSIRLWIDAICINQGDIVERNAQVAQMAKVYSCASHVIVWLGEGESRQHDVAIFHLASMPPRPLYDDHEKAAGGSFIHPDGYEVDVGTAMKALTALSMDRVHRGPYSTEAMVNRAADALPGEAVLRDVHALVDITCRFFQRRYWRRRWIAQELCHADHDALEIRWGPCCYRGLPRLLKGVLRDVLYWTEKPPTSYGSRSGVFSDAEVEAAADAVTVQRAIREIRDVQSTARRYRPEPLIRALDLLSFMKCADDRDKLFALSFIQSPFSLVPDYSLTTLEVYIKFANLFVNKGQLHTLFTWINHEEFERGCTRSEELPSWVPDLRSLGLAFLQDVDDEVAVRFTSEPSVLECDVEVLGVVADIKEEMFKGNASFALRLKDRTGTVSRGRIPIVCGEERRPRLDDVVCALIDAQNLSYKMSTRLVIFRKTTRLHDHKDVYHFIQHTGYVEGWRQPTRPDRRTIYLA